jgi:hypothetical protein
LCIDPVVLPVRADEPDIDDAIGIIDPHYDAIAQDFAWARGRLLRQQRSSFFPTTAAKFLSLMGNFAVNRVAMRILELVRVDTIPNIAFKMPTDTSC